MLYFFLSAASVFVLFLIPKLWNLFYKSIRVRFAECKSIYQEVVLLSETTEKRCSKYIHGFTPQAIEKLNLVIAIRRNIELLLKNMEKAIEDKNYEIFNLLSNLFDSKELSRRELKSVIEYAGNTFSDLKNWKENFEFALADITTELEARSNENIDITIPNIRRRNSTITIIKELRDYLVNRF